MVHLTDGGSAPLAAKVGHLNTHTYQEPACSVILITQGSELIAANNARTLHSRSLALQTLTSGRTHTGGFSGFSMLTAAHIQKKKVVPKQGDIYN